MRNHFSRRDFLKGSIVVALGVGGAGALGGCSSSSTASTTDSEGEGTTTDASAAEGGTVTLHRGYGAPHGERSFASVVVATAADGAILAANVDEFQYYDATTEGIEGLPNSDAGFGENCAEGMVLMSKRDNNDVYSTALAENGGATQTWLESIQAIEAYCVGKTASELSGVDAVSGSTLTDSANYLALIGEIADDETIVSSGEYSGDSSDLVLGRAYYAAHGESAVADAVSLVEGNVLVAASIDEFQYGSTDSGYEGVPNADASFGENFAEGMVLFSKCQNSDAYSSTMAERGGATVPYIENIQAIEEYVAGYDIDELAAEDIDTVSGATLADTPGYVAAAVAAANVARGVDTVSETTQEEADTESETTQEDADTVSGATQ